MALCVINMIVELHFVTSSSWYWKTEFFIEVVVTALVEGIDKESVDLAANRWPRLVATQGFMWAYHLGPFTRIRVHVALL